MKYTIFHADAAGSPREARTLVSEKLFRLTVNGRELLTLVASPHDPESLVTGFLALQRLIATTDDIVTLGACPESGQVAVSIRGELPDILRPTLTSGCGGGIMFDSLIPADNKPEAGSGGVVYPPEAVQAGMDDLFQAAEQYAVHGGIHSAGLSDGSGLLLHAEDLGRHNTIDRIAGMALRRKIPTTGRLLLTSGRISSEMAIKASRLGVAAIASRTSPTDLAVEVCRHCHIGLAGYVRGGSMEIHANAERFGV